MLLVTTPTTAPKTLALPQACRIERTQHRGLKPPKCNAFELSVATMMPWKGRPATKRKIALGHDPGIIKKLKAG